MRREPTDGQIESKLLVSDSDREIPSRGSMDKPETTFTEFPALSVDPRVGISRSVSDR